MPFIGINIIITLAIITLISSGLMIMVTPILAQEPIVPGASQECLCRSFTCSAANSSENPCYKYCCGTYELNDFAQLGLQVAKLILGLVGSLTLLAFVIGGVMFLVSAGSNEKVAQAKKIITGAVIGLVVVLASYTIVFFVATTILGIPASRVFTTGQF